MKRRQENQPTRIGRKKKTKGIETISKLPNVVPAIKCRLKYLKTQRINDYLQMEQEYIKNQ